MALKREMNHLKRRHPLLALLLLPLLQAVMLFADASCHAATIYNIHVSNLTPASGSVNYITSNNGGDVGVLASGDFRLATLPGTNDDFKIWNSVSAANRSPFITQSLPVHIDGAQDQLFAGQASGSYNLIPANYYATTGRVGYSSIGVGVTWLKTVTTTQWSVVCEGGYCS